MGKKLHGKTINRQTTGYLLLWRPAVISKQGLTISKICDVCLIEHIWAMLKDLKELGQKPNLQLKKVNSLGVKGYEQENMEKSH